MSDRRDVRTRAEFDNNQVFDPCQPVTNPSTLSVRALCEPIPIAEHQNIRARQFSTVRTYGQRRPQAASVIVGQRIEGVRRPGLAGTRFHALHVMYRAVTFDYSCLVESCLLE